MIAFNYSNQLEDSFLYSNAAVKTPRFSGDYYSIFGNIPDESLYLSVEEVSNEYILTITKTGGDVLQSVSLNIEENGVINNDVITEYHALNSLEDSPDYALTLTLDKESSYRFLVEIVENNSTQDEIDIGLFSAESNLIKLQDTFEAISIISFILGLLGVLVLIRSFATNKNGK